MGQSTDDTDVTPSTQPISMSRRPRRCVMPVRPLFDRRFIGVETDSYAVLGGLLGIDVTPYVPTGSDLYVDSRIWKR